MESNTTRSKWKLRDVIIEHSKSDDFYIAAQEWEPIWYDEDEDCQSECICGKQHIKELNAIKNKYTGYELIVGSECINYFMELDTTNVFKRLGEIKTNPELAMTPKLLNAISRLNILDNWQLNFYSNTSLKRNLNSKQMAKRIEINKKVVDVISKRRYQFIESQKSTSILSDTEVCELLGL